MAQRYDIWTYYDKMVTYKDDNGDWVKYDDHYAEITQLRAELAAERELADRLAEHLGYAVNGSGEWWADESRIHISNHESRRNK